MSEQSDEVFTVSSLIAALEEFRLMYGGKHDVVVYKNSTGIIAPMVGGAVLYAEGPLDPSCERADRKAAMLYIKD